MPSPSAEFIAIGTELLRSGRVETNSIAIAQELAALGVDLRFKTVVGDRRADLMDAVRVGASRAQVVILTGGLGPTCDDVTREAIAALTRRPLRRHPVALAGMRERLAAWGRTPTKAQLRQALIPRGAAVLSNPVGSAPGFCLIWKGCLLVALPGVPYEATQMMATGVVPRLKARFRETSCHPFASRSLHTFGLPESEVEARLNGVVPAGTGLTLGLLASPRGVTVIYTAEPRPKNAGRTRGEKDERRLDRVVDAARERLGVLLYAEGPDSMEQVVGRLLKAQGLTLAVAESCTGGLIGHRLTDVPGTSEYLDRVVVCYSNRAKTELLGVPEELFLRHGAVSAEVAAAMAAAVRTRSGTDVGVSVTGIAGPGGGTGQKPVGLVYVGLDASPKSTGRAGRAVDRFAKEFRFHGERDVIKLRASQAALDLLRRWLLGAEPFQN